MARKAIECRRLFPDSECTMLFFGEAADVVQAFNEHAASSHPYPDAPTAGRVESALQNVVYMGGGRSYVGDEFAQLPSGDIQVPGPGFVVRRFDYSALDSPIGGTLNCGCGSGTGTCTISISGSVAACNNDSCTSCAWTVSIPAGAAPDPIVLAQDWMLNDA